MKNKTLKPIIMLLAACCSSAVLAAPQIKPNIIYILCDDLGYGDISILNKDGKITGEPTGDLDRLTFLEMLMDSDDAEDIFIIEYKKVRKKWAKRIQGNNSAIEKLLDTCCKELYSVLFDEQGQLIFPDTR